MRSNGPAVSEGGRVIAFRPRQDVRVRGNRDLDSAPSAGHASAGKSRQECPQAQDDDGNHRIIISCLGLVFCIVLAVIGVWLVNEFAHMKRIEDCVLSGRTGCVAPQLPQRSG